MGATVLHNTFGMFENGDLHNGSEGFPWASEYVSSGGPLPNRDNGYLKINGGNGSSAFGTDKFYPDIRDDGATLLKAYPQITYMKTLTLDSNGNKSGGHIGMVPFDEDNNIIYQRHLGGRANTYLSRDLSAGDSYAYVSSNSGWDTRSNYIYRHLQIYPEDHPKYYRPHRYTRIGLGDYNIYYSTNGPELTAQGDYKLTLVNSSNTATTFPDIGYDTPSGTPVSNGVAGSTYMYGNYMHTYPTDWTRVAVTYTTMGNFGMGNYMPWGVKYLKFLILRNYTYRSGPNDGSFAIANMFVGPKMGGKDYSQILS